MRNDDLLRKRIADLDDLARRELAAAASEGRFDDLDRLIPIAKDVAALAARWCSGSESIATENVPATPHEVVLESQGPPKEATPEVRPVLLKHPKSVDYPQFLREKNDLVKLGWSPREKGPYEHRVAKDGVEAVASAVVAMGKAGHRFAMDDLLRAISDSKTSDQIPSYKIYAALSWLKWAGLVLQHGRQGYTVVRPQTFVTSMETAWLSLPQR